jgi:lipopolysaccharide export system ATP-binding protein
MSSDAQTSVAQGATSTGMPDRLAANGLVKSFRGRKVVKGVSLDVQAGEVVGLLGPNGAGKTTIFDMMVGTVSAG